MVDVAPGLVIKELADIAVVAGHALVAGLAFGCMEESESATARQTLQQLVVITIMRWFWAVSIIAKYGALGAMLSKTSDCQLRHHLAKVQHEHNVALTQLPASHHRQA